MDSNGSSYEPDNTGPLEGDADAVRKILASLVLTKKNFSLYPDGHSICTSSVERTFSLLVEYLDRHKNLRLDIEKDQMSSLGEVVYSAPFEEGTLSYILFRDGIKWIQFCEGMESFELQEVIRILNRYSMISDESEGDTVTGLWESRLPHVCYEVAELFIDGGNEEDAILSISLEHGDEKPLPLREGQLAELNGPADPPIDQASIILSGPELNIIEEMVRAEEQADQTEYLDALFDSLLHYREKENYEIILDVLAEEIKHSLGRRSYSTAFTIISNLQAISRPDGAESAWINNLVEDFLLHVSTSRSLAGLEDTWASIDGAEICDLRQFLLLLQPEAIHALVVLAVKDQPAELRKMLLEVLVSLASKDLRPLESLLKNPDEKTGRILIHVLASIQGDEPLKGLMKLTRHPSQHVRHEALKRLVQKVPVHNRELFRLIDDRDEAIRTIILKQIGLSRDKAVEGLLLDYMKRPEFEKADNGLVTACFTALGRCGSARSIPFLKETLFENAWMPFAGKVTHRKGAAIALNMLGLKESMQVLENAKKSLYPGLRRIMHEVRSGMSH